MSKEIVYRKLSELNANDRGEERRLDDAEAVV